ncbi:hypothetical protein SAMN04487969_15012 [Paenibacillus algorifonticola]|uniref:Uncharacterized protein n=1 Tax=Paenibacillus algorifonticola TaxID=684063 RepID=A0A1I2J4Z9_9BACL|nr:hypothetical protein SAMN04487969_15012 [Paenibacillus algorifonticola]
MQVHNFPLLSVKRTIGPHFLGLAIPLGSLTYTGIKLQWIVFPYYYIAIGAACAVLIAAMHAMLEFFLTRCRTSRMCMQTGVGLLLLS